MGSAEELIVATSGPGPAAAATESTPPTTLQRRRRRRRPGRAGLIVLAVVAGMALIWLVLTIRWFVSPTDRAPERADAVVVLLGGNGERLDRGLALIDAGVSDTLVLSIDDWPWREWRAVMPYCIGEAEINAVCLVADTGTTRGEARSVAELAEERDWTSLALITSEYHIHRAEILFDHCFDGRLYTAAADARLSPVQLGREWAGTIHAELVDRSC